MGLRERLQASIQARPWLRTAANLFGHRRRRIWCADNRAHIELRALTPELFPSVVTALEGSVGAFPGVAWIQINGALGRLIVAFEGDGDGSSLEAILATLEGIERGLGIDSLPFAEVIPDYPADLEPIARKTVDLTADALGAVLGLGLRVVGYRPSRPGFDTAALLTIVDNTPRIREVLVRNLGSAATEVGLGVTNAFVQAVGAGPIGPLVDMLGIAVKLRAERARHRAWLRREPSLCGHPAPAHWPPVTTPPRPGTLADGAVERYADDALYASLGGFLVGLADTHDLAAATSPLFGGLPKAALYGRNFFGAEVMRLLSERGVLCLRTAALRVLDRIDTVVIHERALLRDEAVVAAITAIPGATSAPEEQEKSEAIKEEEAILAALHRLLDRAPSPLAEATVTDGAWRLLPATRALSETSSSEGKVALSALLRARPGPALVLLRGEKPVACAHLGPGLRPGAAALLAQIRRAGLRLVLATASPALTANAAADLVDVVEPAAIIAAIRQRQAAGGGVLVIADGPAEALAAADVGLGLTLDPAAPPWTADLIASDDLEAALLVIDACAAAREVAEESVTLAGIGAALGAAIALGGLRKTKPQQVMLATHAAAVVALGNGLRRAKLLAERPPLPQADPTPWHRLAVEGVAERLGSSTLGLADAAAAARRPRPPSLPTPAWLLLRAVIAELTNPLTPILAAGAALSAITGSLTDAALIAGTFGLNGLIGGIERFTAEREIAALEHREWPEVTVCRDGAWRILRADGLAVGDLIELESGDVVPADARLIEAVDLEVDESSLTGESLPVAKDPRPSFAAAIAERTSMLYAGTSIAAGRARALVVALGRDTEARRGEGRGRDPSRLRGVEARLHRLTEMTLPIAGVSGALLVGAGLLRRQEFRGLIDLGVSMTVAAVPEGLPLLATVAQLAAARRLSARGAIVRNPRTVEALGRMDVLCADKTGTLTEGRIALHAIADGQRLAEVDGAPLPPWARGVLAAALRASPAARDGGELAHSTDRAVVDGAAAIAVAATADLASWRRVDDMPFEPGRGYYGALGRHDAGLLISVKGAPEVVIPRCAALSAGEAASHGTAPTPLDADGRAALLARADELAAAGLRILAVAERPASETRDLDDDRIDGLCLRGFLALSDPPRATAAAALRRLEGAGIATVMITGDHPRTAARIAEELGLLGDREVLTGPELAALADDALDARLPRVAVIARATPADKVRIVGALQRSGRVVGMTGDGANDASAIRLADIGIALGEQSTAAAREAADLVVVDGRIDTIVDAIAEGRAMWGSVRDAVAILTGGNLGEIGFTLLTGLLGGTSSLSARQILLINLLTDVAPALAIALRPPSLDTLGEVLAEGPETALGDSLDREIVLRAVTTAGSAGAAHILASLLPGGRRGAPTVALLALVGAQLGQTLASGPPTRAVLASGLGGLGLLLGIVETPGLSHFFGCRPIGPIGLGIAFTTSAVATVASAVAPPLLDRLLPALQRRFAGAETPGPEDRVNENSPAGGPDPQPGA